MTATAPRHHPLARLVAWWRWRRARPYRGDAEYALIVPEVADEWEARRP